MYKNFELRKLFLFIFFCLYCFIQAYCNKNTEDFIYEIEVYEVTDIGNIPRRISKNEKRKRAFDFNDDT